MLEAGGDQERNIIQEVTGRKRRQAMISIIRIIICYRMSFDFPLGQGAAVLGLLRCTRYGTMVEYFEYLRVVGIRYFLPVIFFLAAFFYSYNLCKIIMS